MFILTASEVFTDFVAKQNGVACYLPFMGQSEKLKVEIGKTTPSIKISLACEY